MKDGQKGRRCILVSIKADVSEAMALAETLGLEVAGVEVQRRDQPDPRTFVGSGKTEELKAKVKELDVDLIVVNGELKPSQVHSLSSATGVEVYDRIRVILEIFDSRAQSQEARLQVELATLKHRVPLIKETINLLRKGERPGLLAGGEVGTHQYLREITHKMSKVQRELEDVARVREVRRKHRQRSSFVTVSIAGYTNAGKTSALNLLTEAGAEVDSRWFSTLSPLSRTVEGIEGRILINDTVGFIEDLPPWLIEAFQSTLEELYSSDLVLLVLDVGEPMDVLARKARTSLDILKRGGEELPTLFLLNKVDMIAPSDLKAKVEALKEQGLLTGPWLPVQLNVTRPSRREATREALISAILSNLRSISMLDLVLPAGSNPFDVIVEDPVGTERRLLDVIKERAVYVDHSGREEGRVTFAVEETFAPQIERLVAAVPGGTVRLTKHSISDIYERKV